jgi:hypothetical protein
MRGRRRSPPSLSRTTEPLPALIDFISAMGRVLAEGGWFGALPPVDAGVHVVHALHAKREDRLWEVKLATKNKAL